MYLDWWIEEGPALRQDEVAIITSKILWLLIFLASSLY
jgi:hypothetical protein